MKVLKKKNKYEKVAPLPRGYISLILAKRLADSNNRYKKSYSRLVNLLQDGWSFSSREEGKKALAKKIKPKSKKESKNKSKNKNK